MVCTEVADPEHGVSVTGPRTTRQPESSAQEVLAGLVERVMFHNADTGFCVLLIKGCLRRSLLIGRLHLRDLG